MQLYNALSRKKEDFIPVRPGKASVYACGITAYDYCHIGHARSAVVFDVLVRRLEQTGLDVTFVRNFTDVDDKIIKRAAGEGTTSDAVAERFIRAFHEDMDRLNVRRPDAEPRATRYIKAMTQLCRTLVDKGHAYAVPGGDVYFRVRSFAGYGKLSGRDPDELRAGARVAPGEEKEDPLDFTLWKSAKPGEPAWDSPWGPGRPGWHIECSAMSAQELPLPLDIHGGGQDLIFPHHENEIAQSEAAWGREFARFWVHNGLVRVNSEKMSKSLNNFKTVRDILVDCPPEVLRYFLLTRHYRSPMDFSAEALEDAEKNLRRIYETLDLLERTLGPAGTPVDSSGGGVGPDGSEGATQEFERLAAAWEAALDDDLNTAASLGHVNNLLHLVQRVLDDKVLRAGAGARHLPARAAALLPAWQAVFGIFLLPPRQFLEDLKRLRAARRRIDAAQVEAMLRERTEARGRKDFAAADRLRAALADLGVEVRDSAQGSEWDVP
ncbi:MAG: cysteine--tRNA ligase [Desulfovibrio sp.]|jgi:cysteinyl-tRNA synthetase|nr:cysteine--tRNA ligase [Desulfovibrio sp.]